MVLTAKDLTQAEQAAAERQVSNILKRRFHRCVRLLHAARGEADRSAEKRVEATKPLITRRLQARRAGTMSRRRLHVAVVRIGRT